MAKHYLKLGKILQRLLYDKRMNASELAREVDLPVPTVHRLVTGKSTRPYPSSLKPIADFFSLEVEQLLGEKPLPDNDEPDQQTTTNSLINTQISHIPLVPWDHLPYEEHDNQSEKIPYIGPISREAFATIMPDTSMEPFIQRESVLILDPTIKPTDRSYILVELQDTDSYVLRQILIDADNRYLKPLNPDLGSFKMRLLDEKDKIIACLVEARNKFYSKNNNLKNKELES